MARISLMSPVAARRVCTSVGNRRSGRGAGGGRHRGLRLPRRCGRVHSPPPYIRRTFAVHSPYIRPPPLLVPAPLPRRDRESGMTGTQNLIGKQSRVGLTLQLLAHTRVFSVENAVCKDSYR